MQDLLALEKQKGWLELAQHLLDISPAQRDQAWEKLAEHAAVELLNASSTEHDVMTSLRYAEELPKRFPSLMTSKAFIDKRAEVGLKGYEACYDSSEDATVCNQRFFGFVSVDRNNTALAMKAGLLVMRKQFHYFAIPFFKVAVVGKANNARECANAELKDATEAAVKLPDSDALHAEGVAVRNACGGRK